MSNNIYDILKKIESLEAPKKTLTESKMSTVKELHNESKKEKSSNKGSIAEAVAKVESQLNEKYMGFKKLEKSIAAKGDVRDPAAVAASIGRKKYGKAKFQKAAAAGKKLGEGNMAEDTRVAMRRGPGADMIRYEKDSPDSGAAQHRKDTAQAVKTLRASGKKLSVGDEAKVGDKTVDRYSRANEGAVEESGLQAYLGKKKYGEAGMKALQKAGREGASKEKMAMIRAKHDKMDEGTYNEDMLSAKEKSFAALAEPKDKITYADKIAGAKKGKKDESNKFIGNLMKARADGKDEADLDGDGDMEKVSKGVSTMREGWEEMQKYLDKKKGPQSKGGEGKKAGTRYGGSAQKDDDDETDGEGKPVEKKKGRPKGTGGGAKFSFKKPKD